MTKLCGSGTRRVLATVVAGMKHGKVTSKTRRTLGGLVAGLMLFTAMASTAQAQERTDSELDAYRAAIDNTEAMVWHNEVNRLAAEHGLDVVNVAWEDTGRYDNSSVGPNISDVTIQVARPIPGTDEHSLALMPVIRHPNFSDTTGDIEIEKFFVPVGNEEGDELRSVTLEEYLGNIGRYLSDDGGVTPNLSLLADRDSHVLVSAQAAFLPVPQEGVAEFNPVIFNYQSYAANPAVLTIVVTSEGTSATIIDNERDGFSSGGSWGQRLFFNLDGERASLTGERASDITTGPGEGGNDNDAEGLFADPPTIAAEAGSDSNVVLIIQVPLKHEGFYFEDYESDGDCFDCDYLMAAEPEAASDVEDAIIGHGEVEGPFTELDGLMIERDPDFPVRVTVQYYKATATGEATAEDMDAIAAAIERVYEDADYVGSLVTDGLTGRPTEYEGNHIEPDGWWSAFFRLHPELFERAG